jgi:hypothetical protein
MSELSFLERAGCYVDALEQTNLLKMEHRATDAASFANRHPNPKAIDKAVDLQRAYINEVDRIRIWSPDPEEMCLADFALARLNAIKGNLGIFDAPESEEDE